MCLKKVAAIKDVIEEQRAGPDAAGARMAELESCRDEASAAYAMFRKEPLQVQKNLEAALEKVKVSLAHAAMMAKERGAVTAKYEELHLGVEQCVGFANKGMARLEAEVVKANQERFAILAKGGQLLIEVQCVLELAKEPKKLRERMSALETAPRAKVSKDEKLPGSKSKKKKTAVVAEMDQGQVKLVSRNAHVAKLKVLATEF